MKYSIIRVNIYTISFVICSVIFIVCSNPFETREPEPPTEDKSNWVQPIIPERVMDNLRYSIQEGNILNYMKCFTDTASRFKFIPDDLVRRNNPSFFDQWNLTSEQSYMSQVVSATTDSLRKVSFYNITVVNDPDSVLINFNYELEFRHNRGVVYPKIYKGQTDFWLNSGNGEWYITTWIDYGTEEDPSWSSVKVIFGK